MIESVRFAKVYGRPLICRKPVENGETINVVSIVKGPWNISNLIEPVLIIAILGRDALSTLSILSGITSFFSH